MIDDDGSVQQERLRLVWVQFAAAALTVCLSDANTAEQDATLASRMADALLDQYKKRFE